MKKKFLKYYFCISILCLGVQISFAQNRTISGTVYNGITGKPISGVIVRIFGVDGFTNSSSDGKYSIEISDKVSDIVFSPFENMELMEIKNVSYAIIDIYLSEVDLSTLSIEDLMNIKVTTASKFIEPMLLTPAAMSVVTAKDIELMGANNLFEVLERATSIYGLGTYIWEHELMSVRGTVTTQFNVHVLLLLNGRPLREPHQTGYNQPIYMGIPVESIENIEIIRGTGSVLYGTNAYSGVINIITKEAKENTQLYAKSGYGSFNTWQSAIGGSKKWEKGYIKTHIIANQTDGWDFTARGESDMALVNGVETFINPPKTIQMSDNVLSAVFEAGYKNFTAQLFAVQQKSTSMNDSPNWPSYSDVGFAGIEYFGNLHYGEKWSDKWEWNIDMDYTNYQRDKTAQGLAYHSANSYSLLGETSVLYKLNPNLRILAGVLSSYSFCDYFHNFLNSDGSLYDIFNKPPNPDPLKAIDNKSDISYSAYFQCAYKPFHFLDFDFGGQFNKTASPKWDFVPRINTVLHFNDHYFLKLIYGQAFRAPTLFDRYINTNVLDSRSAERLIVMAGGGADVKAEKISTTGIQISFVNKYVHLSLTGFYNYEFNTISRSLPSDSLVIANAGEIGKKLAIPKVINKGEFESKGIEFEAKVNIFKNLIVPISFSLFEVGNGSVNQLSMGLPNTMLKTGLSYEWVENGVSIGIFNSFYGKGDDIGAKYPNANPSVKAYNFLSANIRLNFRKLIDISSWTKGDVILDVYGTNLLNEQIYYPEYNRRIINSIPGRPGRFINIGLKCGI